MRRSLATFLLVCATALSATLTAAPAQADSGTAADTRADVHLKRAYDLQSATWRYGPRRFTVTAHLRTVKRAANYTLVSRSAHGWEGYPVVARVTWRQTGKSMRLRMSYSIGSWITLDCAGMTARRQNGPGGFLRVSVPNRCLFRGYEMGEFSVNTSDVRRRPGTVDRVALPGVLSGG